MGLTRRPSSARSWRRERVHGAGEGPACRSSSPSWAIAPEPWTIDVPLARVTLALGRVERDDGESCARDSSRSSARRTEEVLPTEPTRALDPVPGLDLTRARQSSLGGVNSAYADIAFQRVEGSNNWVVSGKKTRSGQADSRERSASRDHASVGPLHHAPGGSGLERDRRRRAREPRRVDRA